MSKWNSILPKCSLKLKSSVLQAWSLLPSHTLQGQLQGWEGRLPCKGWAEGGKEILWEETQQGLLCSQLPCRCCLSSHGAWASRSACWDLRGEKGDLGEQLEAGTHRCLLVSRKFYCHHLCLQTGPLFLFVLIA